MRRATIAASAVIAAACYSAAAVGGALQFNLSKGTVEHAFDDSGGVINQPGDLLAFRHRSGSGT